MEKMDWKSLETSTTSFEKTKKSVLKNTNLLKKMVDFKSHTASASHTALYDFSTIHHVATKKELSPKMLKQTLARTNTPHTSKQNLALSRTST